uniref:Uncharacterized protein n=1 Tax=Odontella aurita TaxID=265563 RepID=A0A7S4J695_9STRA|mmetsp:Transcript_39743/g.119470  ORF Transcript_39743/g.119470 Transcript_39743/m.119470 type:complete len:615 (+) Transcript_39743:190-2034(+)
MNISMPSATMNVPVAERAAGVGGSRRNASGGGLGGGSRNVRRMSGASSGMASLNIQDLLAGSDGGGAGANEPPRKSINFNSSLGNGLGMGKIRMPQKSIKSLFASNRLGKSSKRHGSGKLPCEDEDDFCEGGNGGGDLLSEAGGGGGGASSVKSFGSSLGRSPKLLKKKSYMGIKTKKEKQEKTVLDLLGKKSWRKVRARLKMEEGRREGAASLMSSNHSCREEASTTGSVSVPNTTGHPNFPTAPLQQTVYSMTIPASTEENVLHLAVRTRAPCSVVNALLEVCPSLAVEVDASRRRTTLHLAASPEARPHRPTEDVIGAVMTANPAAVWARDSAGRLPLHLACMASDEDDPSAAARGGQEGHWEAAIMCILRREIDGTVVEDLSSRAPCTLLAEDDAGRIPAEYALEAGDENVRVDVLDGLLEDGEKEWDRRRKREKETRKLLFSSGDGTSDSIDAEDGNDGNGVEGEYERWLARRTSCFREALSEFHHWCDLQENRSFNAAGDGAGEDKSRQLRDWKEYERRINADRGVAELLGEEESLHGRDKKARRGRSDTRDRGDNGPAVPQFVDVDSSQNDEWVEDELELEFEEEWDDARLAGISSEGRRNSEPQSR